MLPESLLRNAGDLKCDYHLNKKSRIYAQFFFNFFKQEGRHDNCPSILKYIQVISTTHILDDNLFSIYIQCYLGQVIVI